MRIHKAKSLIKIALYSAIIACAGGAATGTLAWYSYQKDVNIGLTGTSIKADKEIQVGLRATSRNTEFEKLYKLGEIEIEEDVTFGGANTTPFTIYWVRGNYVSEVLHDFQKIALESAVGTLNAITSGKYETGAPESWGATNPADGTWTGFKKQPYNVPGKTEHGGFITKTDYKDYFYLPLAFRAISEEKDAQGQPIYLKDEKIFLSEFVTKDMEAGDNDLVNLGKAIRCKVDYPSHADTSDNFIFNPNKNADEDLAVGGRLNIQHDIYLDYSFYDKKQVAYGEWENVTWKDNPTTTAPTIEMDDCTTFKGNNLKGGFEIDMENSEPSVCKTLASTSAIEVDYENGHGITATSDANNYAYVDLSIYLEGWDENIINLTAGRQFKVDLQFSLE